MSYILEDGIVKQNITIPEKTEIIVLGKKETLIASLKDSIERYQTTIESVTEQQKQAKIKLELIKKL